MYVVFQVFEVISNRNNIKPRQGRAKINLKKSQNYRREDEASMKVSPGGADPTVQISAALKIHITACKNKMFSPEL